MKPRVYASLLILLPALCGIAIAAENSKLLIPPADAQWTILCEVYTGPHHQFEAHTAKDFWTQASNLPGFYVVHQQDQSTLYYGYYRSIADPHDHKESDRAQADRLRVEQLVDPSGQRPFVGCVFVELIPKDPPAPAEWNLVNAKGHWSLQVGVYEGDSHRKQFAVDAVREMRAHGIKDAYFYHGPTASSVCIGAWPDEAVTQEQPQASDPNQPVIVSNQPLDQTEAFARNTGQRLQQITPKVKIIDPNLQALMTQYPYEAINGEMEVRDAGGHLIKGATPSYLVEIPHEQAKDSTAQQDDNNSQLPPAFVPPQPPPTDATTGGLRPSTPNNFMQLLIATTNPGKLREFRQMLGDEFSYVDLSAFPNVREIEETGQTFAENAALKATGYALQTKQWTLADDSGLMVDSLHGTPGIYSARWSQRHNRAPGDAQNNQLLLEQLKDIPEIQRTARFACALALSDPTGEIILTAEDFVAGQILHQPRGSNGFGYDPLFYVPELNRTAAELTHEEKSRISHRGKALRKLKQILNTIELRMDTNEHE